MEKGESLMNLKIRLNESREIAFRIRQMKKEKEK